ncbi:hypothetical protein CPB85DRAFT_1342572 [Mucidula mucida]|nr:hypothetical protein CPB85DRAFT_1342572 [Mucidula mucida]
MSGEMSHASRSASRSSAISSFPEPGAHTNRKKFFDFSPPPLVRRRGQPVPVPSAPLHYLDTHLCGGLTLKRVEVLPSMHVELFDGLLESYSDALDTRGDSLFQIDGSLPYGTNTGADAMSISNRRQDGIEVPLAQIASKLVVHPSQPRLSGALSWSGAPWDRKPYIIDELYGSQNIAL